MGAPKKFALTIELTPRFMAGLALRRRITEHTWRFRIVAPLRARRGIVCEICKFAAENAQIMDSHEVFEFPEDGTVRLAAIQILCSRCHDIKDFAQTERLIAAGFKPAERRELIIEHFCFVNKCTRTEFDEHLDDAKRRLWEIEKRYGSNITDDRIDYGSFQDEFIKCQERRRAVPPERRGSVAINWYGAAKRAVKIAIRHGVHPDYHDEIMEIAWQDTSFREEILGLIRSRQYDAAVALITEALEESRDAGESACDPLPDHEFIYTPDGELYGHRMPRD